MEFKVGDYCYLRFRVAVYLGDILGPVERDDLVRIERRSGTRLNRVYEIRVVGGPRDGARTVVNSISFGRKLTPIECLALAEKQEEE